MIEQIGPVASSTISSPSFFQAATLIGCRGEEVSNLGRSLLAFSVNEITEGDN